MYTATQIESSVHKNNDNSHLDANEQMAVYRSKRNEYHTVCSLVSLDLGCLHCRMELFCVNGMPSIRSIISMRIGVVHLYWPERRHRSVH